MLGVLGWVGLGWAVWCGLGWLGGGGGVVFYFVDTVLFVGRFL